MAVYIIIGIIIIFALLVIRRWRKSTVVVFTTLLVSVIAVAIALTLLPDRKSLGGEAWYQLEPYSWILVYIVMLLGMFVSVLTKAIDKRKAKIAQYAKVEEKKQVELSIDVYDFIYPFLLSFLTFGTVYSQLEENQMAFTSFILAFQTGFFWDTIVNSMKSKHEEAL